MEYKTAMEKMTFLMCGDDLCRIRTEQDEDGIIKVIIDLHGMSKKNAIRMITNIMVLFRFKFRLEVVHGYNHGTAIKEYIYNELSPIPKPTYLSINELFKYLLLW